MSRLPNTRVGGSPFTDETIVAVWDKAKKDPEYLLFRRDRCGALIQREKFGKFERWGWEIDHIQPVANGGTDRLINLQPLQWENNRHKGDDFPDWECKITSKLQK